MSVISEAAKLKACELANATETAFGSSGWNAREAMRFDSMAAFARYIQAVSDAAKEVALDVGHEASEPLARFILPDPVDPLLDACRKVGVGRQVADELRTQLAFEGFQVVKIVEAK